jgi:hypothetical protein
MHRIPFSLIAVTIFAARLAAAPPPELVAPFGAAELAVAPNLAALETHFGRTQMARIYNDPSMRGFFDGAGAELIGLFELPDAIGLKWADLKSVSGGPLASVSIPLPGRQLGTVVIVDVTGHHEAVQSALQAAKTKQAGIAIRDQVIAGASVAVWSLPDGAKSRPVGVLIKDDLLLIADPPEAIGPIVTAWGDPKRTLAGSAAYQSIRARTVMKPGEPTHLTWYFDPFGWDGATRPPVLTGKKKRAKDIMEVLKEQGFDGIRAVGGSVAFAAGECDVLVRTAIYAPKPYRAALQMLSFRPASEPTPTVNLPGGLAACVVARLDPMTAFESFGGIFDEIAADGEKGTYKELIDDLRDNPKGPRVDLRKEIVGQVGEVVTIVTDCQQPLTPTSERAAAVFTVKDEKIVAAAIRRAVEDDPKVKRTDIGGRTVWELVSDPPPVKKGEPTPPPAANAALCVADGKFYIATQTSLLETLFRSTAQPLAAHSDYQRVARQFDRFGGGTACVRLFARPEEDFRLTYDMWRKGQLDQATSIYAYGLNGLLPKNPATNTIWGLNGQKLPAYDDVSKHLGPAGVLLFVHPEGWDAIAFALPRTP